MPSPPYKISSKSNNRFKSCPHLRNLNVPHFETVEATGFNTIESMSLLMSSPPCEMSSKSTKRFKSYYGVSLHPRQKFKRPPSWNCWSYEIKNMMSRLPWMTVPACQISRKSTDLFKSYYWGTHRQTHTHTDRQAADLISSLSFFESRLKSIKTRFISMIKSCVLHHCF
jgi:hypothetical protein